MATRVDLDINTVKEALEAKLASNKRSQNTTKKPEFLELYRAEANRLQIAINTLAESK